MLNEVPYRGSRAPTDPLIYRFYELVMVNGPAWKALIEEEFGDGIMSPSTSTWRSSAPNPKGDRQDHHVRQVPALQILRQRAGILNTASRSRETNVGLRAPRLSGSAQAAFLYFAAAARVDRCGPTPRSGFVIGVLATDR